MESEIKFKNSNNNVKVRDNLNLNPNDFNKKFKSFKFHKILENIENNILTPQNYLIFIINTKKSLLMPFKNQNQDQEIKDENLEYDINNTCFSRVFDLMQFYYELNENSFKNINSPKIYNDIKIFKLNKNLQYLGDKNLLATDKIQELKTTILRNCLKFTNQTDECDLYNSLNELINYFGNKNIFPDVSDKSKNLDYKNLDAEKQIFFNYIPDKNKFFRIVYFNGVLTELIDINSLDSLLKTFQSKYNIVLNYFNFEYDFQYEKKINPIFLKNNLLDKKNIQIFLENNFIDKKNSNQIFIENNLLDKKNINNNFFLNSIENENEITYTEIIKIYKNEIKKNEDEFLKYFNDILKIKNILAVNNDLENSINKIDDIFSKFMEDYFIIDTNFKKYNEYLKTNIHNSQIEYIKIYFNEMLQKKVINKKLVSAKEAVNFPELVKFMDNITRNLIKDLENILNSSKNFIEEINSKSKFFLFFLIYRFKLLLL